jgi:organic radical activating enzyme
MRTLKINLFYKCTAQCSHCRFNCTIDHPIKPDYNTSYVVAKKLNDNFGLDKVVVLGGEPSIYPIQTSELLSKIHELGISTRLETNAYWAISFESAMEFLRPIKLSETSIMLSVDAFHSQYIPYTNNVHAIKACRLLDIPFNLEIPYLDIQYKNHPIDIETKKLEIKIKSEFDFEIPTYTGNVIFIGRAADTFGGVFSAGKGIPHTPCTHVPWWTDSTINSTELLILEPGGWITKGCGIAIGNVFRQDITEMILGYNAENNPIFSVLMHKGPFGLAKKAEKFGYTIKSDYADKCHLCHEARQVLKRYYSDILQPDDHYVSDLFSKLG